MPSEDVPQEARALRRTSLPDVQRRRPDSHSCACSVTKADDIITIRVTGNGFLYNMVRIIAGTLIQVGGGQIEPEQMEQILAARDREAAGPTAPAHGLTMMGIEYVEEKDIDTQGVV